MTDLTGDFEHENGGTGESGRAPFDALGPDWVSQSSQCSHKYAVTDPITGLPIETNGAIDLWVNHEIVRNNLWDRWVITSARQYLGHCWTLK